MLAHNLFSCRNENKSFQKPSVHNCLGIRIQMSVNKQFLFFIPLISSS